MRDLDVTDLDVDDLAALVNAQEGRERLDAVLLEPTREHVARAATETLRIHHFCVVLLFTPVTMRMVCSST